MADNVEFRVRLDQDGQGQPVVWVSGELDMATAPAFRECMQSLGDQRVTVDLSEVTFMDSSGLAVLTWKHRDGGLTLRGVQPEQMTVLKVTRLDKEFEFDGESATA